MAKIDHIKTSFVGGEFGASLQGRVDVAQYDYACETIENFLVRPYGPVISTPGTEFIQETKLSEAGSNSAIRLLPFVFSRTDSYMLEFGESYFRFYNNGGIVVTTGTTPFELAHTFTASQITDVQYAQLNDVIYLTHPDHLPQKLTRLAAESWTIADFAFKGGPFMPDNTDETISLSVSDSTGTINITVSPTTSTIFTVSAGTIGHQNAYWKIGGVLTNSTTGLEVQGYVQIDYVTNAYTATASVIKNLTVTGATTSWAEGSWSAVRGYPARVAFHQGRLVMARTAAQPQNAWLSKTFVYDDFLPGAEDDDGLNFELSSNESNEIQWVASAKNLLLGTYGGEFSIKSSEDSPLTPSNSSAISETSWGSEPIQPKKIGHFLYYVQRFGQKVREIFYNWDFDTYKAGDKTILSPHIAGTGDGIKEIAYQQNPESILWCVRNDGQIATLTREIDQEVQAWSRQTTTGTYETIAVIPSQNSAHDEVWTVVRRSIDGTDSKRFIERFKDMTVPARQDNCFYVHSGLSYDAYDESDGTDVSLSVTSGTTCVVTVSASTFSASDVGQRIRAIDGDGVTLGELEITAYTSATIVIGRIKNDFSTTAYDGGEWGLSVSTISGLDHLETETVVVLADGGTDKPDKTVSAGTITLSNDSFVVHAGKGYNQNIKTLPIDLGSQRGTSQTKIQRINEVALKVNRAHKGFYIGGTEDLIERVSFRDPTTLLGSPEELYTGVMANLTLRGDWVRGAQVYIRNSDPLPLEILNIVSTVDTEDK